MARYERGVYEPPAEDIRVFDASEEDEDTEGSRLPLLIVIALLVLAAFGGVVYLAYTQGVARGRADGPRIITADSGPVKVAPGEQANGTPYQGLKIYEQPAPTDEEVEQDSAPPPPTLVEEAPPVQAAPPAPTPELRAPAKVEAPKPAAPPPATTVTATPPKPVTATAAPTPLKPAPVVTPPKPVVAATPATPAPASSGAYYLQIGSFKSEADANTAWRAFQAKNGSLTAGYSPNIQKSDLGEKGTWYRLRMGSFSSKESATATCQKLGGGCLIAR